MRNRFDPVSGKRKMRGRRATARRWLGALVCALVVCGSVWLAVRARAEGDAAAPVVELVRLSVTSEAGLVRIEVVADGSLAQTTIEQHTRGSEAVVRIRGARSLLRGSYAVDESLARGVRTGAGESKGEPFVDIMISLSEGATLAQRKNFNRLVIGIASDFAGLRRKTDAPAGSEVARRSEAPAPREVAAARSVSVTSATVTDAMPQRGMATSERTETVAGVQTEVRTAALSNVNAPVAAVNAASAPVFQSVAQLRPPAIAPRFFAPLYDNAAPPAQAESLSFFPMFLEAPGASVGAWLPGTTVAVTDQAGGRTLGAGFLRPLFRLGGGFDDNFFYRSSTGRNIGLFTFAPRLEYEIPGDKSGMRLAYEARLRRLTNGEWANGHVVDFDTRFNLGSSVRLALRDHFIRSPLDPREYDAAGEVYIVGDTFWRNDGALRLELLTSQRGRIAFDLGYNLVRWSEDHIATAPLFLNYGDLSSSVSYERDLSEATTASLTFSFANANASSPLRSQFDGLNDRQRYALEFGARHQVTEGSGLAFRVGYERDLFRHAPSANNFSGLVFDVRFSGDVTEKTKFELAALRKTQLSAFNLEGGNARLISTGGAARLEHALGDTLKLGLSLNYQRLGFPVAILGNSTASGGVFVGSFAGERRDEHLYGFGFDATYEWSELLRARLRYDFGRRDSTIPVFTFNTNRVSLIFEFGRRNEVKGRPF
ncbi:MAG: outer membrane beta-barrel protein [Acidobacteria bacterium]|nr:outer membrane beta-barrel protein [Acidobacteriota bacterium]